jgi:hypothetical protein
LEISVATEPKMTALRPQAIAMATHVKICPKQRQRFRDGQYAFEKQARRGAARRGMHASTKPRLQGETRAARAAGMDGWMDGWMEGWMDGWIDGRRDGCAGAVQQTCAVPSHHKER